MINWWEKFIDLDIFFISPDVKRGLGVEDKLPHYHIICSTFDPLIPAVRRKGANIFCLEEKMGNSAFKVNNSGTLLEQSGVEEYIKQNSKVAPFIMYFKPSLKLDLLIKNRGYRPIGNNAYLNEQFENKLYFHELILKHLPQFTVETVVGILGELNYGQLVKKLDLPFVIQFGHGWAGKTTFFIDKEEAFLNLAHKFTHTKVKVSKKINGFTVLNNCCLSQGLVLLGSPAIQISDIPILSSKPGMTCGRQWPAKFLHKKQIDQIDNISLFIGKLMNERGFRGFFGLDFLIEETTGKIYLSEINARLTASTSFYTYLERGLDKVPFLIYHMCAFLHLSLPKAERNADEISGSQIIFRSNVGKYALPQNDFGVYRLKNGKPILIKKEYSVENLSFDEFIYTQKTFQSKKAGDEERARLETKREVLNSPKQLQSWLNNLLFLSEDSPEL